MNAITLDIGREALANRALGGVRGIGGAHDFAELFDRVLALQRQQYDRPLGHEFDQAGVERPFLVNGIKRLRLRFAQPRHAHTEDLETRLLEHCENLARMPRRHRIRLNNRKSTFHTHSLLFTVSPRLAGVGHTVMPAASMAAILSLALPLPPAIIAPACPIRRPGGAVCPAINPTTGFFTW